MCPDNYIPYQILENNVIGMSIFQADIHSILTNT